MVDPRVKLENDNTGSRVTIGCGEDDNTNQGRLCQIEANNRLQQIIVTAFPLAITHSSPYFYRANIFIYFGCRVSVVHQNSVVDGGLWAKDMLALTKPKITIMTLLVALGGILHAGPLSWWALIVLLGIAFLVSGSSALNMYLERDHDARMSRTATRPLPAGRLDARWAILVGTFCAVCASAILWWSTNLLTLVAGIISLIIYVWCYTPLKQHSWTSLLVGSIPGAMPVMLGYCAFAGVIDEKAIALFLWAFLWQIPHFLAISLFRESEYTAAGFPVLSRLIGKNATKQVLLVSSWLLVFSTVGLYWSLILSETLSLIAGLVGVWFLYICHQGFSIMPVDDWARRAFKASLIYQSILFVLIIIAAIRY